MKRIFLIGIAGLLLAPALAFGAIPSNWTGAQVGAQVGWTKTSLDGFSSENALSLGVQGGYNYQLNRHVVVGGDLFYEWNQKKDHTFALFNSKTNFGSNVYGVDGLVGFPVGQEGRFMPYLKVGYGHLEGTGAASGSDNAWRYGAGLQWRMDAPVSLYAQYMYQKFGASSGNWKNETFAFGAIYHF